MLYESYVREYARLFRTFDRNMWNYEDGCVLIGLQAMYEATGDRFYYDAICSFMDRYIEADGSIRGYDSSEYNLDRIPNGRVLFLLYRTTGERRYRVAATHLMDQLRAQPRVKAGNYWHKAIYPDQVWLDGLYMALPFYALYERDFGSGDGYEDIVSQFESVMRHLYDDASGLCYHAWDESRKIFWADKRTGLSPNFWSRSIGWFLMAAADVYELLPSDRQPLKDRLFAVWKKAMDGMLAYQDAESGMFYQLTALKDEPGNYLETTGTLMTAFSSLKGVRFGLFPEGYAEAAMKALLGTESRKFVFKDGYLSLDGMCVGAGLGPDGNFKRDGSVRYYLSEAVVPDEQKGAGVAMMAYAEYLKAQSAGALLQDYPKVRIFKKKYPAILPTDPDFVP